MVELFWENQLWLPRKKISTYKESPTFGSYNVCALDVSEDVATHKSAHGKIAWHTKSDYDEGVDDDSCQMKLVPSLVLVDKCSFPAEVNSVLSNKKMGGGGSSKVLADHCLF